MQNNKDLFQKFREASSNMKETPSPKAWRRLERKLDRRKRENNLRVVRFLSMAAAVILLVGVIYIFSSTFSKYERAKVASFDTKASEMEDLIYSSDETKEIKMLVQYRNKMPNRSSNPGAFINEGPGKKLVPVRILNGKRMDIKKSNQKDSLGRDSLKI